MPLLRNAPEPIWFYSSEDTAMLAQRQGPGSMVGRVVWQGLRDV